MHADFGRQSPGRRTTASEPTRLPRAGSSGPAHGHLGRIPSGLYRALQELGTPSFAVLSQLKGEIQIWLAQHSKHRRTEENGLRPSSMDSSGASRLQLFSEAANLKAITDPLTGLGNRRMIHLERRRYREDGSCFGLLLLDLNDFKAINDTWDHQVGDAALLRFTHILRTCTRHSDSVIRLGGDEFLIVAKDTDAEGMQLLADRISLMSHRHRLELPNGQQHRISSAFGWACYPQDGDEWEVLIALADQRMYSHKASMKSSVA